MREYMTLKFYLMVITICLFQNSLKCNPWKTITIEIAIEGNKNNRADFELAKQTFLHIKDENEALLAAQAIEKKWMDFWGLEATAGTKARKGTLMNLIRYPLMTKEDAKKATIELFYNNLIKQFLDEQNLEATTYQ